MTKLDWPLGESEMPKDIGVVSEREGKLVLTVASRYLSRDWKKLVELLNSNRVDVIEVTNHGKAVCLITSPSPQSARLAVGKLKLSE